METTTKTKLVNYLYGQKLVDKINETTRKIHDYVENYNKDKSDEEKLIVKGNILTDTILTSICFKSKSQQKHINKLIFRLEQKWTLRNMNLFLHYICKEVIKVEPRVRIEPSLKEQRIQKARKEWLVLRDKADAALKVYKEEKGDFYKKKLEVK